MARTFKDKREFKAKRRKFFQPLWTKRFEHSRYKGDLSDNSDLDFCPSCYAPTDFQGGFITCAKCDWGNYFPANKRKKKQQEEEFEYESAA